MTVQRSCRSEETKKQAYCKTDIQKKQLTGIKIYFSPWGIISLKASSQNYNKKSFLEWVSKRTNGFWIEFLSQIIQIQS